MALPVWAGAKAEQPAMAVAARIADFIMVLYLFSVKSERSQWVVEDPPSTRNRHKPNNGTSLNWGALPSR